MARIFVAMSGGVDSSVAAALLVEQGHDVTGVTMRLLSDAHADDGCCSADGVRSAKRVCDTLGIAHYTFEFADDFRRDVIMPYCEAYAAGDTPNPCIACNDRVKFGELMRRVMLQGADALATGHYARMQTGPTGETWLARAVDASKDQTYFLYRMSGEQRARTVFPLGELVKDAVRELARGYGLPTAERPESQETCFVPDGDVRAYVRACAPGSFVPGEIVDSSGRVVGRHDGVCGYTLGQRRGLGVSGAGRSYVTAIDTAAARVVVGDRGMLARTVVIARDPVWRDADGPVRVTARTRYRGPEVPAWAQVRDGLLTVRFDRAIEAPASGQAIVCYVEDRVYGGGVVEESR